MIRPGITAALAISLASTALAQPDERILMVGHGHIDPVWRWTQDEGRQTVFATFRSALDRMKEFDDFKFSASSAQFYAWVAEADPSMLEEIRRRVDEGRWEIVGGWWVEPDLNIPHGESLVRQGLYGQQLFQQHFGRRASIGFNPDSFGHPATLPQIIRGQGMDAYYFMRPSPAEMPGLPAPVFHWRTPDGASVLGVQIQTSYGGEENRIDARIEQYRARFRDTLPQVRAFAYFYGVGDHGGGPTVRTIQAIRDHRRGTYPGMDFATARQYADLMLEADASFPEHTGELLHHARGCYTAASAVKQGNRDAERALLTAEKLACMARLYAGTPYPHEALAAAWKKVLFNQFHDILAGTSIERAYIDASHDYGYVQSVCRDIITGSAHAVSQLVHTADAEAGESIAFVVFNPGSRRLTDTVAFEAERFPGRRGAKVVLRDADGRAVPFQEVRTAAVKIGGRISFVFNPDVPAMGYRLYRLDFTERSEPAAPAASVTATATTLENSHVRVTFDPATGGIASYFDKRLDRELIDGHAAMPIVLTDPGDTWGHRIDRYDQEVGRFAQPRFTVLEAGPIRARLAVETRFGDSIITQDFALTSHSPALECHVTIDWRQKQQVLKLSFPTVMSGGTLTAGVPYGHVARPLDGDEQPMQTWIDLSHADARGGMGLAILCDGRSGYSAQGGDLRLSILKSNAWSHHAPATLSEDDGYRYIDQGITACRYILLPHDGDFRLAQVPARAEDLLTPPVLLVTTNHQGPLPAEATLVSSSSPDVGLPAVKMAENGDALVARLVELHGRPAVTDIALPLLRKASRVEMKPGEIVTLLLPLRGGAIRATNLLED